MNRVAPPQRGIRITIPVQARLHSDTIPDGSDKDAFHSLSLWEREWVRARKDCRCASALTLTLSHREREPILLGTCPRRSRCGNLPDAPPVQKFQ